MRIRDILREKGPDVYTVPADRTVHEAVRELNRHRVGALVVTGPKGAVEGIVSERDILHAAAATWDDEGDTRERLRDRPVADLMTTEVIVATPDDDLDYAMGIMTQNRIRHLPIVAEGRLAGIVSIGDVVRAHLRETSYDNKMMRDYIQQGAIAP
ncbi:MAG: CBS domain-containing protein [Gemmatimonadota bacterium]